MAPELCTAAPPLCDPSIDIWAMGVLLHELVNKRRPIEGESELPIFMQLFKLTTGRRTIRSATLGAPEYWPGTAFGALITTMMDLNWGNRATIDAVLAHGFFHDINEEQARKTLMTVKFPGLPPALLQEVQATGGQPRPLDALVLPGPFPSDLKAAIEAMKTPALNPALEPPVRRR